MSAFSFSQQLRVKHRIRVAQFPLRAFLFVDTVNDMRGFFLIVLLIAAVGVALYLSPPQVPIPDVQFTQEDVKQMIVTELHRELPAAFLVSGHLEITADITQENTKYLFPDYFDKSISLGTTKSTVRLPGRVSYGVDLMKIDATSIMFEPNNVVVINVDAIEVESVDPDLANMQVQTEVGWARMHARSGHAVERKAVVIAKDALEAEALSHLQTSPQPTYNTEAALSRIVVPVLDAAGFPNATIRIQRGVPIRLPER